MSDKRARAYMITGNNPEKYYSWAKNPSISKEDKFINIANNAIKEFVDGSNNHKDRTPDKNGAVCVVEIGKNKTLHFHLYVCSKNPIRFSALQKKFPHSQIEILRGTVAQTLDYLHKRGKHKDTKSILKCEPVYWGDYLCDNRGLTGNSLMDEIDEMLINGATPEDIYATAPKYAFYAGAIERTYNARKVNEIPNFQDVYVEYHVGEPGTGKTHTYIHLCNQGLADCIYLVSGDYKNPWDMYDFTKHKILFLDELRAGCLKTSTLLNITDGYKMILPARYSNKHKNWNKVIISTVMPPEQLFCSSLSGFSTIENDSFEQFKRRLNLIIYHYIDDYFADNQKYRFITVLPNEYKNLQDLKNLAEEEKSHHGGLCYEG